jgi:hypothetical protein
MPHDAQDLAAWAAQQAAVLRARGVSGVAWSHMAEEAEMLHDYQRVEIECHLHVLLMHGLRWAVEPGTGEAWPSTITSSRIDLDSFQQTSPGLAAAWPALLASAYADARRHGGSGASTRVAVRPIPYPSAREEAATITLTMVCWKSEQF